MYEVDDILYAGKPVAMVSVLAVQPLEDYKLLLTFNTGEKRIFDMKPLLDYPVYQPLKNQELFRTALVDWETVSWCNGDIDVAPETLYQNSVENPDAVSGF